MTSVGVLLLAAACATPAPVVSRPAPPPAAAPAPQEPIPTLQLPPDVRPTHYALELTIDPAQPAFSGTAKIDLTLAAPRSVLWLHGRELEVSESSVRVGSEVLPAVFEQVNDDGVVKLTLPRAIGPGPATLQLSWKRAFDPRLVGLYLAKEAGVSCAFTQFEDLYARRAFPGFDEPRFKTPFDVTLVVPSAAVAVANTPAVSEEPAGEGLKRVRYATTRPLPTYLLAWAVGPFDVVEAPALQPNALRSTPVPMRGIGPRGRGGELDFGLKTASALLLLEEQYFGVAYPYGKLDTVSVPDSTVAMENAGAILYGEDYLLNKPGLTSDERRQSIASVIAHEQAHQWFGDLVTMPWWEDAWLNEAFATWMEAHIVERWKPEWNAGTDLQKNAERAMGIDALAAARAIRQPLTSVKNIPDQFDPLTYQKGAVVIGMFEHFMGPERFRAGVGSYIAEHADGSGSTDDLLAALSKAAGSDLATPFRTFLDQAGVPLVSASVSCAGTPTVTLAQSRFLPVGSLAAQDRSWQIPVCLRLGERGGSRTQCLLFTAPRQTIELPSCPEWLMPNAEAKGYYRWSVSGADLSKLRAGYAGLNRPERISFARALQAGVSSAAISIAEALDALEPIARDPDGEVATEAIPLVKLARERLVSADQVSEVDAYAARLFAPALKRLGFFAKRAEGTADRRLRKDVLELLAWTGQPAVVAQLQRKGLAYAGLKDGVFHPEAVDADLAELALSVAVEHGDARLFEALEKRLETSVDAEVRERIITALSTARDAERSTKALALTLSPALRKSEVILPLWFHHRDARTREASWAYAKSHYDELAARLPEAFGLAFLPALADGFCDAAHADDAALFFKDRAQKEPGMPANLRQAVERVRLCAANVEAQRSSAQAFFKPRGKGTVKTLPGR